MPGQERLPSARSLMLAVLGLGTSLGTLSVPCARAQEPAPLPAPPADATSSDSPAGEPASVPVAAAPAAQAPAETTTPAAAAAGPANRLVEEVVVTAQKREQRLQDVPISIQAFSQDRLDVLGIQSVQDVQRATPGFTVTNAAGFNIVFLRGVGSDAYLPGVDSSVPFYLDGVPLLGIQGTADTLGRIERVEVLKGPQGTLFGRNSTGGAISIVTPEPDQTFAGDVKVGFGNEYTTDVTAYINVPLADSLAFNLSGFDNQNKNFMVNDGTGGTYPVYARGGRLKLRWNVTDELSATFNASYQENSSNGSLDFQLMYPAPRVSPGLPTYLPADPKFDRHLATDGAFGTQNQAYILGTNIVWNADSFDSKLIYAHQKIQSPHVDADFDGSTLPVASAHGAGFGGSKQFVHQDTAELQILSNASTPFSDHLQWVAGLFYLNSLGGFDPIVFNLAPNLLAAAGIPLASQISGPIDTVLGTLGLPPVAGEQGIELANYGLIKSQSYSVYGQGTYHLLEQLDFTGGVRYQYEIRNIENSKTTFVEANGNQTVIPFEQGAFPTLKPKQTSMRFAFQYRPFGPDDQFYASWARGWKSPTYNTVNLVGNTFGGEVPLLAERVDTTEVGVKTRLLNNAVQLNAAAFYTDQEHPLSSNVTIISGGIANFTNAQQAVIHGFDGDFLATPLPSLDPGLVITGSASYLNAFYSKFTNGRGYDDTTGLGFGDGGASGPARDFSGNKIPRVPTFSYQLALSQRIEMENSNALELGFDTFHSSKIYFLPQNSNLSKRDPLQLYNARATYFFKPWNLELTAYCNNILNKLYVESTFVSDFGTAYIANSDPRLFGLRAKVTF